MMAEYTLKLDQRVRDREAERLQQENGIDTVYLVTDSDADYRAMARGLTAPHKYQLYRDYLDNFRINSRR